MKKLKKVGLCVLICLVIAAITGCGGTDGRESSGTAATSEETAASATPVSEQPIELDYAFFAAASTFPAKQMEKWKEELEKRTNGKVKVNLFFGGSLLTDKNMYDGVKSGVADIGSSVTTYEPGKFPLFSIVEAPTVFPNALVSSQTAYNLLKEFTPDTFKDVKLITAFTSEPNFIQTKERVETIEDLHGMQLRVSGGLAPIISKLGATPVGMSQSEAVEALQTGVVEGYVSSREVLRDLNFAEMVNYAVDYPLTLSIHAAVMNMDTWNSLPPDVQQVIDELGPEMSAWTGEYMDNTAKESLQWAIEEHGFEVVALTPEEKARWDELMKPIQDEIVADLQAQGLPAEEFKQRLDELKEQFMKE